VKQEMKKTNLTAWAWLFTVFILALPFCSNCPAQDTATATHSVVTRKTYEGVLDRLFPRDDPDTDNSLQTFVIRFKPSFQPESQINVRQTWDRIEVTEYRVSGGNVYQRLNEILANGGAEDEAAMAKSIDVRTRNFSIPQRQSDRWHARLLDGIARSTATLRTSLVYVERTRQINLPLDGTFYQIWYSQGLSKMSMELYDVEIDKRGAKPEFDLVEWMFSLRREVSALK
jgi:hypothetical protein